MTEMRIHHARIPYTMTSRCGASLDGLGSWASNEFVSCPACLGELAKASQLSPPQPPREAEG